MTIKACPICGKEFKQSSNSQIYCCDGCRRVAADRKNKDRITKRNEGLSGVKFKIYAAYHGECAICGWKSALTVTADKNGKMDWAFGNELHHIIPAKEGGKADGENLILLCPNHHKQADRGLISREELRRHQKPVPLPRREVDKDLQMIEEATLEYAEYQKEHPDSKGISEEALKYIQATDLACMLGNAGLIDEYMDWTVEPYGSYVYTTTLREDIKGSCKEAAQRDKESNTYQIKESNWYERILNNNQGD